jgi:hypothetical protein
MTAWAEFAACAPHIAEVFTRRHASAGGLCMLGTLRSDGWPRVSPMEPRVFEDELWIGGMPHTAKFADLVRDPRFTMHTATVDTHVGDGDAKFWGVAHDVPDPALHWRYAEWLYAETGFDLRGPRSTTSSPPTWTARRRWRSAAVTWTSRSGSQGSRSAWSASTEGDLSERSSGAAVYGHV